VWSRVYFVSNLHANIISLGQFQEEGMKVMSYDDRVKIYEERGNLLTVVKRSINQLYEIQLEVVCASVQDTDSHVGQQEAVGSDEMALVEPELTPVGSSSVATPCTVTKVSEEVDVSMPEGLEAQPECTQTTDITSCDIPDQEVVSLHGGHSNDKKVVEQQVVVLEAMTRATLVVDEASPCNLIVRVAPIVDWSVGAAISSVRAITGIMALNGLVGRAKEAMPRSAPSKLRNYVSLGANESFASHGRKQLANLRELAHTYSLCNGQVYRPTADRPRESTRKYFVEPQLGKCGTATSTMMFCPKTAESTGQPPTHIRLRRLLDLYRENVLRDKYLMKTKRICECSLSSKESVKFEEADKDDGWRQAMDKPRTEKLVTWMLEGIITTMSRMTLARSS
jgi:hypothetical protein